MLCATMQDKDKFSLSPFQLVSVLLSYALCCFLASVLFWWGGFVVVVAVCWWWCFVLCLKKVCKALSTVCKSVGISLGTSFLWPMWPVLFVWVGDWGLRHLGKTIYSFILPWSSQLLWLVFSLPNTGRWKQKCVTLHSAPHNHQNLPFVTWQEHADSYMVGSHLISLFPSHVVGLRLIVLMLNASHQLESLTPFFFLLRYCTAAK